MYGSGARNTETYCRKTEKALNSLAYYVSELLGKATIDTNTYGKSTGHSGNYSTNYQITGRELMTPDEVRMLDNRYALLFIRGEPAVKDYKFDIMKHPNVGLTTDGGAKPYQHGEADGAIGSVSIVTGVLPDGTLDVTQALETGQEEDVYELLSEADLDKYF